MRILTPNTTFAISFQFHTQSSWIQLFFGRVASFTLVDHFNMRHLSVFALTLFLAREAQTADVPAPTPASTIDFSAPTVAADPPARTILSHSNH